MFSRTDPTGTLAPQAREYDWLKSRTRWMGFQDSALQLVPLKCVAEM